MTITVGDFARIDPGVSFGVTITAGGSKAGVPVPSAQTDAMAVFRAIAGSGLVQPGAVPEVDSNGLRIRSMMVAARPVQSADLRRGLSQGSRVQALVGVRVSTQSLAERAVDAATAGPLRRRAEQAARRVTDAAQEALEGVQNAAEESALSVRNIAIVGAVIAGALVLFLVLRR